jgi:hypothetical protein
MTNAFSSVCRPFCRSALPLPPWLLTSLYRLSGRGIGLRGSKRNLLSVQTPSAPVVADFGDLFTRGCVNDNHNRGLAGANRRFVSHGAPFLRRFSNATNSNHLVGVLELSVSAPRPELHRKPIGYRNVCLHTQIKPYRLGFVNRLILPHLSPTRTVELVKI